MALERPPDYRFELAVARIALVQDRARRHVHSRAVRHLQERFLGPEAPQELDEVDHDDFDFFAWVRAGHRGKLDPERQHGVRQVGLVGRICVLAGQGCESAPFVPCLFT